MLTPDEGDFLFHLQGSFGRREQVSSRPLAATQLTGSRVERPAHWTRGQIAYSAWRYAMTVTALQRQCQADCHKAVPKRPVILTLRRPHAKVVRRRLVLPRR